MRRVLISILLLCSLLAGAGVAAFLAGRWWLDQPLPLPGAAAVEFEVKAGSSARAVAQAVVDAGVRSDGRLLYYWFRLSGQGARIRAGYYAITPGTTARSLLDKLVRGEQSLRTITFVEGWTFARMRAALAAQAHIAQDTAGMSEAAIMQAIGKPGVPAEGRFFPDTYTFARGSSALQVLRQAAAAMDHHLHVAWSQRDPATPLQSPDEALILASIVEKETGRHSDRGEIAGVFTNRLRIGMRLQTDPAVIYGLGSAFDGNLRRIHLQTDTPWNTYTRAGLPPTPIAMPGIHSLMAAVRPTQTRALYFVARGDGSSQFSATLAEHNRAVNQYQRRGRATGPEASAGHTAPQP